MANNYKTDFYKGNLCLVVPAGKDKYGKEQSFLIGATKLRAICAAAAQVNAFLDDVDAKAKAAADKRAAVVAAVKPSEAVPDAAAVMMSKFEAVLAELAALKAAQAAAGPVEAVEAVA